MKLDRLDQIAADLEAIMGRECHRSETERLAQELDRNPKERLSKGQLWASTLDEVEDDLFIPDSEMLPGRIVNHIVSQLLRQDYPAWRRFLEGRGRRETGDYDKPGNGDFN